MPYITTGSVGFRSTMITLYNKNVDSLKTRLKPDEGFMALNQSNNENKIRTKSF